jgi:hypothetical protein
MMWVSTIERSDRILGGSWTLSSKDPPHANMGLAVATDILQYDYTGIQLSIR